MYTYILAYDLRVQSGVTTVQLVYFGFITNNTGEDWTDVKLSLSTAVPSLGGAPPSLQTLQVATDDSGTNDVSLIL